MPTLPIPTRLPCKVAELYNLAFCEGTQHLLLIHRAGCYAQEALNIQPSEMATRLEGPVHKLTETGRHCIMSSINNIVSTDFKDTALRRRTGRFRCICGHLRWCWGSMPSLQGTTVWGPAWYSTAEQNDLHLTLRTPRGWCLAVSVFIMWTSMLRRPAAAELIGCRLSDANGSGFALYRLPGRRGCVSTTSRRRCC